MADFDDNVNQIIIFINTYYCAAVGLDLSFENWKL